MRENVVIMSDPNDPFAAQPYVPPTEPPVASDDTVDVPAVAETEATDASTEPTERPNPDYAAAEPISPAMPPPPAVPAPIATPESSRVSSNEPTERFTHRYPSEAAAAAFAATAASGASTQQLPPFTSFPTSTEGGEPPKEKKKRGRRALVAGSVILLGAASGVGGAAGYAALTGNDSPTVNSLNSSSTGDSIPAGAIERVAQSVLPSVVQINVRGSGDSGTGTGTGIIISSDGQILTNNHVVEGAATSGTITVSFNDGGIGRASILGRDPVTDLAVIKVKDKTGLTPATLGNSRDLKVGQEVVAIGSPFGLESTVTSGIISALNRPVSSSDGTNGKRGTVFPAVQTDAAINPGNSGGPLVDLDGKVVAINSAIRTSSGSLTAQSGSIGLGFAIPIDLAKNVSKHLVKGEKVEHAMIGIQVSAATDGDGTTTVGAEVKDVTSGSPGEKAGLKKGDIITALNGTAVGSANGLVASIRGYEPGQTVTLTFLRNGKTQTAEVTLASDGGDLGS